MKQDQAEDQAEEQTETLMGYYSKTMDEKYGHVVWKTPNGKVVTVTTVGPRPNYNDVVEVGEVTEWIAGALKRF